MYCPTHAKLAAPGLALVLVLGACSDGDDGPGTNSGEVQALNLQTGEQATYESVEVVPPGWGICPENDCSELPPEFPCTRLGPGACLLNRVCGLRLRCDIEIDDPIRPFEGSYDPEVAPGDAADGSYPVGCELICLPKNKVTCEQIHDGKQCSTRADCDWQRQCTDAVPACLGGDEDCTEKVTVCQPVCRPKTAESCDRLDQRGCTSRSDCEWNPGVCSLLCSYPDCEGSICEPFCQPKKPDPQCPPVARPDCPDDEIVTETDERGCVTAYCKPPAGECKATGCSGQICAAEDIASTCEWAPWYQCYKQAKCETQASGQCGWTPNDAFEACMKEHGNPTEPNCPTDCGAWCVGQAPAGCENPGCRCPEPEPDSCILEYVRDCPEGQIDGCVLGTTDVHDCVPRPDDCSTDIAIQCPPGQIDGCNTGATTVHRCVPSETKCERGGCSGQLCVGPGDPAFSDCGWVEWYGCYKLATCEQQPDGGCGFTPNDSFDACMAKLGGPQK